MFKKDRKVIVHVSISIQQGMAGEQAFLEKLLTSLNNTTMQKVIAKGEFLLREGEIERNLYLVKTGAVRVFYLS